MPDTRTAINENQKSTENVADEQKQNWTMQISLPKGKAVAL